jgi:uncharacterized LabA/DUF88 family protein
MKNQKIYKEKKSDNTNMLPGDLYRSPDESFSSTDTLVFIDEAFLSKLSKHLGNGNYIKFDRELFSKNISEKQKLICKKIFIYIAPPFQNPIPTQKEEERKYGYEKFINKLKIKNFIIREGRCQRLKIENNFVYNQKAVDVWLAMDLTNIPIKFPKIKRIILISSDSDFVPVIKNLKENGVKTILYTYYEKKRDSNFSRSNYLIKSVYKYVLIKKEDFEKSPLKDEK